ncbi:MAG: hypothetical protein RLP44_06580 [Aggregatilineales bacterium]
MSDTEQPTPTPAPTPPSGNAWSSPQVVAAIIGGIVTIAVTFIGVLPTLIGDDDPTPTPPPPTVIVVTATETNQPPTATAEVESVASTPEPTTVVEEIPPTETAIAQLAAPAPTEVPNLSLLYDDVSFTVHNISGGVRSLEGVVFRSSSGNWDAYSWGPSIYNSLPVNNCLRIRDTTSGQRQPPSQCGNLYGLILVGQPALFWLNSSTFDVVLNGQTVAVCNSADGACAIHLP